MASLVADYSGSSDDEFESDPRNSDENHGKNLLVINEEESSSEENETLESNQNRAQIRSSENSQDEQLPNPFSTSSNLPTPNLESKPGTGSHLVFSNPFKEEQTRKDFILEQHVKMTEKPKSSTSKKQICWKFRQGKCRFSKNCKFSHDIDNHIESPLVKGNQNAEVPAPKQFSGDVLLKGQGSQVLNPNVPDEDDYMNMNNRRKKRSGVSEGLVPPKKAMVMLNKIQAQERPWTVKR
ncbi:uncharacterized protein LOC115226126 [Octopus sinensis]|uniref:Uncharacterized protein LOC115226126 n=1 Tax=Octopus sinensis TaxID=2607531 RepID=A0A6P7TUC5_9MOLL|nr:uncharacterized protein LOC115226126 [Octopus sinensis]